MRFIPDRPLEHGEKLFKARMDAVGRIVSTHRVSRNLIGESRAGKTSILRHVGRELTRTNAGRGALWIYVDVGVEGGPEAILLSLYDRLSEQRPAVLQKVWSLQHQKAKALQLRRIRSDLERSPADCGRTLTDTFRELGRDESWVVVALDNFDRIEHNPIFHDEAFFRLLTKWLLTGPVSFTVAGRKPAIDVVEAVIRSSQKQGKRWSTESLWGSSFHEEEVCGDVSEREARAFLSEAGEGKLKSRDISVILRYFGTDPYPLQVAGQVFCREFSDRGSVRDERTYAALSNEAYDRLSLWLREMWQRVSFNERAALETLVWGADALTPKQRRRWEGRSLHQYRKQLARRRAFVRRSAQDDMIVMDGFVKDFIQDRWLGLVPVDNGIRVDGRFRPSGRRIIKLVDLISEKNGEALPWEDLKQFFPRAPDYQGTREEKMKALQREWRQALGQDADRYKMSRKKQGDGYLLTVSGSGFSSAARTPAQNDDAVLGVPTKRI